MYEDSKNDKFQGISGFYYRSEYVKLPQDHADDPMPHPNVFVVVVDTLHGRRGFQRERL